MQDRYRLGGLANEQLLGALSALVAEHNAMTADLLAHLAEVGQRRLHLELGFPSLFAYCTEALGFSDSAAGRRVAAARLCRRFGEAFELVARGDLHLSALCSLGPHLNDDNASELLKACIRKSRRQVDELLAARFPRPDFHEAIRRLPASHGAALANAALGRGAECEDPTFQPTLVNVQPSGNRAETADTTQHTPRAPRRDTIEPLSVGRYGVRFTAEARLRDKIDQARALASHRLASDDLARLVELAFDALIRDLRKQRFAVGRKPRTGNPSEPVGRRATIGVARASGSSAGAIESTRQTPLENDASKGASAEGAPHEETSAKVSSRSRRIPAATAREVYERDEGRCTYVSPEGRRCSARHFLEFDHIDPWAEGGDSIPTNLRMRCKAHNQHQARIHFGSERIDGAIARARSARRHALPPAGVPRQSEP